MNDFSTRAKSYEKEADWILSEEFIRPLVPAPFGGRRLLDVCTGTGVIAEYAADLGWDVTAIDDNKDIIQYVDNRIAVVCHDANHLPFDDNSFDLIVCRQGLQYLDRYRAIHEMLRVCKHEVRLLHGFVYREDIDAWKQLFRLMGKNGRDFFNDTAIYDAIAASSPSEIACSYIMNAEIFFMKPDYMDAVKDFFRQRPEFVQRYSLCVHDDHFTYKLKWVVNRIVK